MKRFGWQWLAISSLLAAALAGSAETRPQYGGTLHIAMRAAPTSLDPADGTHLDSFTLRNVALQVFETLVANDGNGRLRPGLAASWQASPGNQHWQFRLRRGVKFHDGTSLTAEIAASSLRGANPSWNVSAEGDSVVIESATPAAGLAAELALPRNAIVKRGAEDKLSGTGPFHISDWQPGKKLSLAAEENYWNGRPFLDAIEIEMGRSFHDQLVALELGRADLVEIAPEQAHRISLDGKRVVSSNPMELVALLFTRDASTPEDKLLREALALCVDRVSIRSVLLQGTGQPAAGILPTWLSGYGFVFSTDPDLTRARRQRGQVRAAPVWTIGYDAGDPMSRLLVDRIALNASDAGLKLQPTTGAADVRLVRIPLAGSDPWISIAQIALAAGLPKPGASGGSAEDLYASEQAMLTTQRLIPLFHLPATYAAAATLKNWMPRPDGSWGLADVWMAGEKTGSAKP